MKLLNYVENYFTGFQFLEWHNGFVMYSAKYLRRIPISELTNSRHIDGELLLCAGLLRESTKPIPVYKKYKQYVF